MEFSFVMWLGGALNIPNEMLLLAKLGEKQKSSKEG